ncbi:hypothetical protein M885DRAFT_522073 [Pelagophyceae sp. CCMP2097]|nr:hypothetical protein M885DRAFT_522073 [Pelagophyceae sp. CCMP2097]
MASLILGAGDAKWVRDIRAIVYDDAKREPSPTALRNLVNYSSDRRMCSDMFDLLEKALLPTATWRILVNAIIVTRYLVIYGAEHVVDRTWRMQRSIKDLGEYNSATAGKYAFQRGGRDEGQDVRRRAAELTGLLANVDQIRLLRSEAAANVDVLRTQQLGGVGAGSGIVIGAGHSLAEIPGFLDGSASMAAGRFSAPAPFEERGFSQRPAPVVDLLDFDACDAGPAVFIPDAGMLLTAEQREVQRRLEAQHAELAQLKLQLARQQQMQQQQQQPPQQQQPQHFQQMQPPYGGMPQGGMARPGPPEPQYSQHMPPQSMQHGGPAGYQQQYAPQSMQQPMPPQQSMQQPMQPQYAQQPMHPQQQQPQYAPSMQQPQQSMQQQYAPQQAMPHSAMQPQYAQQVPPGVQQAYAQQQYAQPQQPYNPF